MWTCAVEVLVRSACAVAFTLAAVGTGAAQPIGPQLTPLVADVMWAPHAFPGSDQRMHLVYEIRIANVTAGRMTLERVAALDARTGATLATLDARAIGGRLSLGGHRGSESTELAPFQFGVIFMHVALEPAASVPTALAHIIEASSEQRSGDISIRLAQTSVISSDVPALGPPLRGHGYVAADGCCDSIRHVRALLALDGAFHLSQRFAVDWEQIDDEGRIFVGDAKNVRSYHIYGKPVLAVADGTVVAARNDLPDQLPGKLPDGLPIDEADGNFVILDIGGGAYALYAHMQLGSVRVHAGDRVRRGDLLGDVGNTGNSQAPHLHFQMMDGPSGFLSNGIPYVFDSFAVTAADEAGTADFDRAEATGSRLMLTPRVPRTVSEKTLPLDLLIVDWRN
jgi:murein DD-endopeptidase MepM/ murein hydrolase activator NlpD